MQLEVSEHAQTVEKQLRLVQERQTLAGDLAECTRLVDASDTHAGGMQLGRNQRQQRPGAGDDHRPPRLDHATLDLQLQAAEQNHSRQRPAGKWHAAFMATGGQQQLRISHLVQLFIAIEHHQSAGAFGADHPMVEAHVDQP